MDKSVLDFNIRLRTIRIRDLAVGIIIAMIITSVLMVIFPIIYDSDDLFFIVFLGCVILFFIWALRGTTGFNKDFSQLFEKNNSKEILFVFATNLIFAFLFMFLISILDLFFGMGDPTWVSIWDIDSVSVDSSIIILEAIASIIFAPVIEELMFRGVLFNRLKIRVGIIPAMIISSFIFAIGHDFGGMTSAFLFGICMCILYLKTDNILVPMSVHFLNNAFATIIELSGFDVAIAQLPWLIPSLAITLIATFYLIKYIIQESRMLKEKFN